LVLGPRYFPLNRDSGDVLRLAKIDLKPLWITAIGRAPAGPGIAIEGVLDLVARLHGGRRRAPSSREISLDQFGLSRFQLRFVVQSSGRPKRSARKQIQKLRRADRLIVMAQRAAKHPRLLAVEIRPDRDLILAGLLILRGRQGVGRGAELGDVIQLARRVPPAQGKSLHDRMRPVGLENFMRVVFPVAVRGDAAELKPIVRLRAIAMHGAMQHNRRQPLAMRLQNALHEGQVLHGREALVVNHHIVALRPIRILVERDLRVGRRTSLHDNIDLDVRALLQPFRNQNLLGLVVVATTAADIQGAEDLGSGQGRSGKRNEQGCDNDENGWAKHHRRNKGKGETDTNFTSRYCAGSRM
jgi:hypothetical protein